MDGIHDMGGMQGFGKVEIEVDEPVFHHEWERRVFALTMAAPFVAGFSDDHLRRQIESIAPCDYLNSTYYQLWFEGLQRQLRELEIVSNQEIARQSVLSGLLASFNAAQQARADELYAAVLQGEPHSMPIESAVAHRFSVGDRVMTRQHVVSRHNRLPRYARGKPGNVIAERAYCRSCDSRHVIPS